MVAAPGQAQATAPACEVQDVTESGTDHPRPVQQGITQSDTVTGFDKIDIVSGCLAEDASSIHAILTLQASGTPGAQQTWSYTAAFANATGGSVTCTHTVGATNPGTTGCTATISGALVTLTFPRAQAGAAGRFLTNLVFSSNGIFVTPTGAVLTSSDRAPDGEAVLFPPAAPYRLGSRAPADLDSDGDGATDRSEVGNGTDPGSPDSDHDGLLDGAGRDVDPSSPEAANFTALGIYQPSPGRFAGEADYGTNATDPDTDGDGLLDGANVTVPAGSPVATYFSNNSLTSVSTGSDGDLYLGELGFGADPTLPDTDADGIFDRDEITGAKNPEGTDSFYAEFPGSTNPAEADSDGDGLTDGEELEGTPATNPNDADTDLDGLTDAEELAGLVTFDGREIEFAPTDPTKADTDGDGASDYDEVRLGSLATDPNDTPGENAPGGQEAGYLILSTIAMLIVILLCIIGVLVRWG